MDIPKIFTTKDDVFNWQIRRKELLKLFEDNVYGKVPKVEFDMEEFGRCEHLTLLNGFTKDVYRLWLSKNNIFLLISTSKWFCFSNKKSHQRWAIMTPYVPLHCFISLLFHQLQIELFSLFSKKSG